MIKPTLHHVNLKTTRMKEMIDWYGVVVGTTVNLQSNNIAFISNDRTHHRIALLAVPGLRNDPEKIVHTGIHHTAFEYDSFDDLMSSFARLKQSGIEPEYCLNHGMATSLYYSDPDQNLVELQVDAALGYTIATLTLRLRDSRRWPGLILPAAVQSVGNIPRA